MRTRILVLVLSILATIGFIVSPSPVGAHTGDVTADCGGPTLHAHDFPANAEHTVTITAVPGDTVSRSFTSDSNGHGQSWVSWTDLGVDIGDVALQGDSVDVTFTWTVDGGNSANTTFTPGADCAPEPPPCEYNPELPATHPDCAPPTTTPTTQPPMTNPPTPETDNPHPNTIPTAPPATPVVGQPNFTG